MHTRRNPTFQQILTSASQIIYSSHLFQLQKSPRPANNRESGFAGEATEAKWRRLSGLPGAAAASILPIL
jgi:hypothetical protein